MVEDVLPRKFCIQVEEGLHESAPGFFFMDTLDRGVKGYVGGWVVAGRRGYIMVETGAGAAVPFWLAAFSRAGISLDRIEWILVTHVHLDHAGGAGELLRHLPNARLGVHPDGVRHLLDPERLRAQAKLAWGDDFDNFGPTMPAPAERVVGLADGDMIELDGMRRLRVLHTPGHTPHHAVFFEETTRGIFSGDALGAMFGDQSTGDFFTIPGISPPLADLPRYLQSVQRIAAIGPQRIYASHFGLWEPALPMIDIATGQVKQLWEICREVRRSGGGLPELQQRALEMLTGRWPAYPEQEELVKNFTAMAAAAWNYVTTRE